MREKYLSRISDTVKIFFLKSTKPDVNFEINWDNSAIPTNSDEVRGARVKFYESYFRYDE